MPVQFGQDGEVSGVGDASMEDQHLLVDHRCQRQPAEDLLQQFEDPFSVNLKENQSLNDFRAQLQA